MAIESVAYAHKKGPCDIAGAVDRVGYGAYLVILELTALFDLVVTAAFPASPVLALTVPDVFTSDLTEVSWFLSAGSERYDVPLEAAVFEEVYTCAAVFMPFSALFLM